ncbi:uncharacterized protein SCODWIG_03213 [Saccharomycodes ludwigii]|uniref:Uncharacterized protein n=1 Tax=Saccharomycodes ludwigii TaxID=36035 RepID=A0A376B9X0_9ASCO|nr:hypothetical protein SCDLUD_003465 [Saccharomycodes ludwigii]KAH3900480.1 hypothetical protein SCDLUD_003465 [Saccharomycodes ludwigii]SSD61452.1 uncharacterized protein SCODWIG_03213 [Saccharomycodes ludwigii]
MKLRTLSPLLSQANINISRILVFPTNVFMVRQFHNTIPQLVGYRRWNELTKRDRQNFIRRYVVLYKEKHPCSKSNVMYKGLASDMEEHDDTPFVFGIMYNELIDVALNKSKHNVKGVGPMGDADFFKLLYK